MTEQREITDVLKRGMEAYVQGNHAFARKLLEWALARMKENAEAQAKKQQSEMAEIDRVRAELRKQHEEQAP